MNYVSSNLWYSIVTVSFSNVCSKLFNITNDLDINITYPSASLTYVKMFGMIGTTYYSYTYFYNCTVNSKIDAVSTSGTISGT